MLHCLSRLNDSPSPHVPHPSPQRSQSTNPEINQIWHHQICQMCKYYSNITSTLVFTIVFWIHYNFLIVWSIWLEICRSTGVFFLTMQNVHARKIRYVSEDLRTRPRSTLPDWLRARNLSRAVRVHIFIIYLHIRKWIFMNWWNAN